MQKRSDPLVPILGAAVSLVVMGAILLFFYPRISSWFDQDQAAVVQPLPAADEAIPLWVCSTEPGVALLIEPVDVVGEGDDPALDSMLDGGPYRYLRLSVYNFDRDEPFRLQLSGRGFDSPEGGVRLLPAAARVRRGLDAPARTVLAGLGGVATLEVPRGQRGQILLVAQVLEGEQADPATRTAFVSGKLKFERREVARMTLAAWHQSPKLKTFQDF